MRTSIRVLVVAAFAIASPWATGRLVVGAQQPAAADHPSGIYVATAGAGSEVLVPLKAALARQETKGIGKAMMTGGFMKPSLESHITGLTANVDVPPQEATFYFYFADSPSQNTLNPNTDPATAFAMLSAGVPSGLPSTTKNANDYVLVRLKPGDGERVADMGKAPGNKPKDAVAFVSEKISPTQFRVKPKEVLSPGEYAFFVTANGGAGQYWDFGVTAPK